MITRIKELPFSIADIEVKEADDKFLEILSEQGEFKIRRPKRDHWKYITKGHRLLVKKEYYNDGEYAMLTILEYL